MSVKKVTGSAVCVALAAATSLVTIYSFPFGGSVTLCSMLFIMLPAWFFGVGTGIISGVVFGLLYFFMFPYFLTIPQFLFDYILAFGIMGLGGIFRHSKGSLIKAYLVAILGRWIMGTIAGLIWVSLGMTAWDGWSPLPYSMAYNGAYIGAEAVITLILLAMPPVKNSLLAIRNRFLN